MGNTCAGAARGVEDTSAELDTQAAFPPSVVEEAQAEEPKVEAPKVDEPKVEEPKVEEPNVEEPNAEEPNVEEPKVEEPKEANEAGRAAEAKAQEVAENDKIPAVTVKVVFGMKGTQKTVEFTQKPLGFEYSQGGKACCGPSAKGVVKVRKVVAKQQAAGLGVQRGSIVQQVNGKDIADANQLRDLLAEAVLALPDAAAADAAATKAVPEAAASDAAAPEAEATDAAAAPKATALEATAAEATALEATAPEATAPEVAAPEAAAAEAAAPEVAAPQTAAPEAATLPATA